MLAARVPSRHLRPFSSSSARPFRSSAAAAAAGRNRVYNSIRHPSDLETLLLATSSSRVPLVTLWTASWCPSCRTVLPLVKGLIEDEGAGEAQGGVSFAEAEYDAPEAGALGMRYMITSLPTLLAFSRGEPQLATRITRLEEFKDREFLRRWVETEASRGGDGGAGGGVGLLGRLFGKT